ncbi:MAG TPA: sensor histidine kinase N-terminal domain-containing protein [Albitalea sp.]|nr:sensor histidine kinase N-terminal domain-containing protein [Albitalea sp.]
MKPSSLRLQLLGWLLVPLVLLLALNAYFSNKAAVATANQAYDRLLLASADAIAENVSVQGGAVAVDLPYAALQLLESNLQERVFYRVIGPDGRTLTGYDDLPLPARRRPTVDDDGVSTFYSASYRGETIHLVALHKRLFGAGPSQPIVIMVAETGESRGALSQQILIEGLARQGLLIAATGVFVWLGLARGLRPLVRLRDGLLARSSSDLSPIDGSAVPSEVRPLIDALNQHTARLDSLIASRQRFIDDASHQMRTPLAEMHMQIDYCLRQDNPQLEHETLQDVQHSIRGMAHLVGQMLLLARSDPAVLDDRRAGAVSLSDLARATAHEYVPAARKKAIDLSFEEGAQDVVVRGNERLLHELVANLLDNAIRYVDHAGLIAVRVYRDEDAVLEVEDNGPGIAADEREKVFERFYRGAAAQGPGSGLGLAIVRSICDSHGARIELGTARSGRGLCVRVRFAPLAAT